MFIFHINQLENEPDSNIDDTATNEDEEAAEGFIWNFFPYVQ